MRFYKITENDKIVGYAATPYDKDDCLDYTEISENEYNKAIEELQAAQTEPENADEN